MTAPAPSLPHVARLFHRLLAAIFLIAWVSLGTQVQILMGSRGLLPLAPYLQQLAADGARVWEAPTLFWLGTSDLALTIGIFFGIALALAALAGFWPRATIGLSTLLYLSYVVAGRTFLSFQWDNLLLECGAAAIFLSRDRRRWWAVFLFRLILFKLYFESGIAKWQSHLGDWRDGSAMTFYYETAPLPTLLARAAHHLPAWWHHFESWATLALELIVPFGIFAPRKIRLPVAVLLTGFQVINLATANYGFFCYLTLALHVFLLDDADVARARAWLRARFRRPVIASAPEPPPDEPSSLARGLSIAAAAIVLPIFCAVSILDGAVAFAPPGPWLEKTARVRALYAPFRIINTYHLFSHITRERIEPELQTFDGSEWSARDLRYKPGDPSRAAPVVAPHQPRVDFQLWFYGLSYRHGTPRWVANLLEKLCRDPAAVAPLFRAPPPAKPRAVRIAFWEYHFSTEKDFWTRKQLDLTQPMPCDSE